MQPGRKKLVIETGMPKLVVAATIAFCGSLTVITTRDALRRRICTPLRSSFSPSLTSDTEPVTGHAQESRRYAPAGGLAHTVYESADKVSAAKLPSEPVFVDPVIVGGAQAGVP